MCIPMNWGTLPGTKPETLQKTCSTSYSTSHIFYQSKNVLRRSSYSSSLFIYQEGWRLISSWQIWMGKWHPFDLSLKNIYRHKIVLFSLFLQNIQKNEIGVGTQQFKYSCNPMTCRGQKRTKPKLEHFTTITCSTSYSTSYSNVFLGGRKTFFRKAF